MEERFTLIAPDDYRGDLLEIKLFDVKARELARESLYSGDEDEEDEDGRTRTPVRPARTASRTRPVASRAGRAAVAPPPR